MSNTVVNVSFSTLVEIKDKQTGEVLVSQSNAIHPENMARVLARGLANEAGHNIYKVGLGNGGTYSDTVGTITYNEPHTTGTDTQLYNETYSEIVDGSIVNGNSITSAASIDTASTVTIAMTIGQDEPGSSQWLTDTAPSGTVQNPIDNSNPNISYEFDFDELGCFAINPLYDTLNPSLHPQYLLLTHLIFQPIAKTQNRQLELLYTITIVCV